MILCPTLKLMVSHVPKTGGSAVVAALDPWLKARVSPDKLPAVEAHPRWSSFRHQHGMHIAQHKLIRRYTDDGWVHAATIRNPWDRALSMYAYFPEEPLGFEAFCRGLPLIRNDTNRTLYVATEQAGPIVHHWLRQEHLQEDMDRLMEGWGIQVPLGQINVSPKYRQGMHTEETVACIANAYSDDISLMGYLPPEIHDSLTRISEKA